MHEVCKQIMLNMVTVIKYEKKQNLKAFNMLINSTVSET